MTKWDLVQGYKDGSISIRNQNDISYWMASLTQWTWVWVNSQSWWWTGRPDVLQSMGSWRVGHDWVIELDWTDKWKKEKTHCHFNRCKKYWQNSTSIYDLKSSVRCIGGTYGTIKMSFMTNPQLTYSMMKTESFSSSISNKRYIFPTFI